MADSKLKSRVFSNFSSLFGLTLILLFIMLFALTGCKKNKIFVQHEVDTQDEAGSVHVSVISVDPWEQYVDALQPTFAITPKSALEQVIPTTQLFEEKFLDAIKIAVKVAPPTSLTSITDVTSNTDGVKTSTREKTSEKGAGDTSGLEFDESIVGDRTAAGLGPKESILVKENLSSDVDPMLRYAAATALYQEVQMLNRYVKDAAIRDGYQAYVVRFQIGLMPNARNSPYDVYSTVSFFMRGNQKDCKEEYCETVNNMQEKDDHILSTDSMKGTSYRSGPGNSSTDYCYYPALDRSQNITPRIHVEGRKNIEIIPLLVTDNVEAMLHSRSVNSITQFAAAVSVMIKGFGGSGNFQSFSEELQSVLGRDLNSLLTVSRISANSIRIRLGAMYQAESKYAMIPRTNNITLLVIVPDEFIKDEGDQREIVAYSISTMLNAIKGTKLPQKAPDTRAKDLDYLISTYFDNPPGKPVQSHEIDCLRKTMVTLLNKVQNNDVVNFNNVATPLFRDRGLDPDYIYSLWAEITELNLGEIYSEFSFHLPFIQGPVLFADQAVLALDDTKKVTKIAMVGGSGLKKEKMNAILYAKPKPKEKDDDKGQKEVKCEDNIVGSYPLPATSISLKHGGEQAEFTFPSLKDWGITSNDLDLVVEYKGRMSYKECNDLSKVECTTTKISEYKNGCEQKSKKECLNLFPENEKECEHKSKQECSLAALKHKCESRVENKCKSEIYTSAGEKERKRCYKGVFYKAKVTGAPDPGFTAKVTTKKITSVAGDGSIEVTVIFKKKEDKTNIRNAVFFELEGADYKIESAGTTGATMDKDIKIIKTTSSGTFKLKLANLNKDQAVKISSWAGKIDKKQFKGSEIALEVNEVKAPAKVASGSQ